jgi:hypothetical protein
MQTAESVCLWNYQFKTNSPPSSNSNMPGKKSTVDDTPYLACTERLSCQNEMSSKATFYCIQCNSLQCILCDKEIHENSKHERLNLDEIDDELCSVDRRHQAVFYCPTCALAFCYTCFENQHQHSDGREHKPQKCREGQRVSTKKSNSDQQTKPIKIVPTTKVNPKPSASSFEDIQVDDTDESRNKPPKRHNFNAQMLLESMLDDGDHSQTISHVQNRLQNVESDKGFLLLDNNEHLTVSSLQDKFD